jgi:MFS family permease
MTTPTLATPAAPDPRRWAALVVLLTGAALGPMDFFIVNVAMPSITAGLGASSGEIQLVISGYAVVYAVFLVTGGRLGDLYGRKRVFLLGLAGFALASALCGLAPSPRLLILGRLVQALAAALMVPQALASIHALFPPHERGRALSIYGIMIGLSSAAGQLLGGALVGADLGGMSWRLIFLINLPIAVLTLLTALPLLRETRSPRPPRLDIGGVALSALALGAFVVPLIEGREQGWPWWSLALLATSPMLFDLFRRYERRLAERGGEPLVAIDLFQSPGLLRGLGAILTLYAMAAFFLTFAIYLQSGLDWTPLQAGLAILPFSAGFLTGSVGSPAIAARLGTATASFGFLGSATGLALTAQLVGFGTAGRAPPLALLIPGLGLIGLGMGLAIPTMVRVIIERVDAHRAGLLGGIVNSTLQISAALGVAILGGLFFVIRGDRTDPAAIAHAFSLTLMAIAASHLTGAGLAIGLGQPRRVEKPA